MNKKLISFLSALVVLFSTSVLKAEVGIGISAAFVSLETDGSETLRDSGEVTKGSHSEDLLVPEVFIEHITDNGGAIGISYIPTRELGNKSRSDTTTTGDGQDTGTYKAKAELKNFIMIYGEYPVYSAMGGNAYVKGGISNTTINTQEALNDGSSYGDQNVMGYQVGLGFKSDIGGNYYGKVEATYSDFDSYRDSSEAALGANTISAETEATAIRLSVGYKF